MKHTLPTLASRFLGILWLVTSVCMFVSCSDDTDEAGGNFKLYYPDMTDIGPSMTDVKIPAPTFQGTTPGEFEIVAVTLNDETIENTCFVIDAATGEITINSTADTPVGEYKLTISCSVGGQYFTFKDIVKVTFLPRAPEGTVAEPNHILVMYNVVSDPNNITKLLTAQVKTAGEHVSITKYSIGTVTVNGEVLDKPEEMFEVSSSGEISILKSERFERGVIYSISLKLETAATGDTPCIAPDILAVEVASEPFSLEYPEYNTEEGWKMPNTSDDEGGSSFTSAVPVFVGSTDGIKYWIEIDNEKGKDKILIDETTGVISVPQGHGFDVGDKFKISVFVANTYLPEGKKLAELNLTITKYYKPLVDGLVFYEDTEVEQTEAILIEQKQLEGFEDLTFELLDNLNGQLTLNENKEIIAPQDNKIAVGSHTIQYRVTNGDGTNMIYSFNLTIKENQSKLVWAKCGNNFGNDIEYQKDIYQNQFRFYKLEDMQNFSAIIKTNLSEEKNVHWEVINSGKFSHTSGLVLSVNGNQLSFSSQAFVAGVSVAILKGTYNESTIKMPIFIDCNAAVEGGIMVDKTYSKKGDFNVEYTPFVFHVNPLIGGVSTAPLIKKDNNVYSEQFILDNRRTFYYEPLYTNFKKGNIATVPNGQTEVEESKRTFLNDMWDQAGAKEDKNYGSKAPFSFYTKDFEKYDLAGVNPDNTIQIEPNIWIYNGTPVDGFIRCQMVFDLQNNQNFASDGKNQGKNSNRVFPIMIWLDPNYYPVTE